MGDLLDIRIGTLVNGLDADSAKYIKQIIPHGFESFEITFWQTLGGKDLRKLADSINEVIIDKNIVVRSVGIFGNQAALDRSAALTLIGASAAGDANPYISEAGRV